MDFIDDLENLAKSPNPYAKKIAGKIKEIQDAHDAGTITDAEALDLLNDMKVSAWLVTMADDLQEKILAQKIIDSLIAVISTII